MPRIELEDKHTYLMYGVNMSGNNRFNNIVEPLNTFHSHTPYYPTQGTGEDQRIGKKINTEVIHHEGYISIPLSSDEIRSDVSLWSRPTILDGWNGYVQDLVARLDPSSYEFPVNKTGFSIPIRHLWIEFKDDAFISGTSADKSVYLSEWFQNLTIQIGSNSNQVPSVQTKTLRESTKFTGDFRIIDDKMYWLTLDKPVVHFNETLTYKRKLSFESEGSDPSNAYLYSLWIAPTQPLFDYFNSGFGSWMNNTTLNPEVPFIVASIQGNIKLKYTDM